MTEVEPTIFIVDDDDAVRKSLSRAIKMRGFLVETFASAKTFLDQFDARRTGCLLLDQGMPEMTGLELQEALLERGYQIPIIFMTGHGGASHSAKAMRRGAIDFLEKPFRQEVLFEQIAVALKANAST